MPPHPTHSTINLRQLDGLAGKLPIDFPLDFPNAVSFTYDLTLLALQPVLRAPIRLQIRWRVEKGVGHARLRG